MEDFAELRRNLLISARVRHEIYAEQLMLQFLDWVSDIFRLLDLRFRFFPFSNFPSPATCSCRIFLFSLFKLIFLVIGLLSIRLRGGLREKMF